MVQRYNKYLVNLQILCNFTHDDTHFSNFAGQHQMMKYTAGTPNATILELIP